MIVAPTQIGCRRAHAAGDTIVSASGGGKRPPAPRRRMSAEARRGQILDAARRVFVRTGFAGARTRDLAAEAGVTEALIYQHFQSKDELLQAAVGEPLADAVAQLIDVSGAPPPKFDVTGEVMYERTRTFVKDLLDAMDDIAPLLGVMLCGDTATATTYYRERLAEPLDAVRDVIDANRPYWNHRDFDPEVLGKLVFGMAWFLCLSDQLAGRKRDRDAVAGEIASMIIFGLDTGAPPASPA